MAVQDIKLIIGPETPGSIDQHELFFARRALMLLKERLGKDGLKKLLAEDIVSANTWWSQKIAESNNEWRVATVTLQAQGISASELLAWFKTSMQDVHVMWAAHPEHYINGHEVLETIGEAVSLFDLKFYPEGPPAFVEEKLREKEKYPMVLAAAGVMQDGKKTVVGNACHQFRDLDESELADGETKGVEAKFGGVMPFAIGEAVAESQTRHLAVEWRNWLRQAVEDTTGRKIERK